MNIVMEFTEGNSNRESLHVDSRGRYFVNGKPASLVKAFNWYATKSSSRMSASSDDYRRKVRLLQRVAALLR